MGYLVSPISPTTSSASQLDLITKGAESDSLSPPFAGIRRSHSISETSKSELHPFPCPQSHGSGLGCSCNGALEIRLPEFQLSGRLEEEEESACEREEGSVCEREEAESACGGLDEEGDKMGSIRVETERVKSGSAENGSEETNGDDYDGNGDDKGSGGDGDAGVGTGGGDEMLQPTPGGASPTGLSSASRFSRPTMAAAAAATAAEVAAAEDGPILRASWPMADGVTTWDCYSKESGRDWNKQPGLANRVVPGGVVALGGAGTGEDGEEGLRREREESGGGLTEEEEGKLQKPTRCSPNGEGSIMIEEQQYSGYRVLGKGVEVEGGTSGGAGDALEASLSGAAVNGAAPVAAPPSPPAPAPARAPSPAPAPPAATATVAVSPPVDVSPAPAPPTATATATSDPLVRAAGGRGSGPLGCELTCDGWEKETVGILDHPGATTAAAVANAAAAASRACAVAAASDATDGRAAQRCSCGLHLEIDEVRKKCDQAVCMSGEARQSKARHEHLEAQRERQDSWHGYRFGDWKQQLARAAELDVRMGRFDWSDLVALYRTEVGGESSSAVAGGGGGGGGAEGLSNAPVMEKSGSVEVTVNSGGIVYFALFRQKVHEAGPKRGEPGHKRAEEEAANRAIEGKLGAQIPPQDTLHSEDNRGVEKAGREWLGGEGEGVDPQPGLAAACIKFAGSRIVVQSERFGAELAMHLGIATPQVRVVHRGNHGRSSTHSSPVLCSATNTNSSSGSGTGTTGRRRATVTGTSSVASLGGSGSGAGACCDDRFALDKENQQQGYLGRVDSCGPGHDAALSAHELAVKQGREWEEVVLAVERLREREVEARGEGGRGGRGEEVDGREGGGKEEASVVEEFLEALQLSRCFLFMGWV
ncbi:unnamed protein product [Closterium sp. NIES-54]